MAFHQAGEQVEFVCQYPVDSSFGHYETGEVLKVGLNRDWDEEEGRGQGGPWGDGYTDALIESLI